MDPIPTSCLYFICSPWKYEKNIPGKIAAWAAFFFVGWIHYPLCFLQKAIRQLRERDKTYAVGNRILDSVAQQLAQFANAKVKGQIHGLYLTSNETHLAETRAWLKTHPRPTRSIHIGCATWHNLDIMCTRRSTYGLIFDFNPKNADFIRKTVELAKACDSRQAFKEAMVTYLQSLRGPERELFFHADQRGCLTDRIAQELDREGSWLQTDENYQVVKELVSKGRLVAITEDITHSETFGNMRKFLDQQNIAIDTLYLSNICNFMKSDSNKSAFAKTVKSLLNENTLLINCPKIHQDNKTTILQQEVTLGRTVLNNAGSHLFEVA